MWFKNKKAEPKTKKEVPTIKGDIRTKERLIKILLSNDHWDRQ